DHEPRAFPLGLAGIPAAALDNAETLRTNERRELSRVVAAHRNLQRYLIHSRFAFIAPPHQLGIEHERIAIEALSPVVACQAASRQSDFPREGFIIREPAAQQFVAR